MDFQLTEEQQMVRDVARQFADEKIRPFAAEIDREHKYPAEIVKQLGEMGFMGVAVPEEFGGAGMDYVTYVHVVEEISRACASTGIIVSVNNSLACHPIQVFGTDEQKKRFLIPLATGQKLGALTMTEPSAGSDPTSILTTMEDAGDHWVVNGTKNFCTNGKEADLLIFLAYSAREQGTRGMTVLVVEKDTPGFTLGKLEDKLGIRGSSTAELIFEDCKIPKENTLGEVNGGFKVCMVTLDAGRIGVAAQALGIARAAIEDAVTFAKERHQFGKPIGANQAIQWMLANMRMEYEAARLLTLQAAAKKDRGERYSFEAALGKLKASEAANFCADRSMQIHGGYGYTSDYRVERYYRDARITEIYEGTSEVMRMVISREMLK